MINAKKIGISLVCVGIAGVVIFIVLKNVGPKTPPASTPTSSVSSTVVDEPSSTIDGGYLIEEEPAGSGEAQMQETTEEEVYVDPVDETPAPEAQEEETPENNRYNEIQDEANSTDGVSSEINLAGGEWGLGDVEVGIDLPTEEDMQWAADMIDQNGTVLH